MTTIGTSASAAAKGRSLVIELAIVLPMNWLLETSLGVMKAPSESEKVKIEPATTAGKASGKITRRKVVKGEAPRSSEALISEFGIRSRPAKIGRIMNGS